MFFRPPTNNAPVRYRVQQLGVAVALSAAGLVFGLGLLTRVVDSPALALAVTR